MRCVRRIGLTTVKTTAPLTVSPGEYLRMGSSGRMWKSVRFLERDRSGEVSLDSNDRVVEGSGDSEGVGVAFAHMLML